MSGDTIILAPPFVATEAEIDEMVDIVRAVVGAL
jgi:adenosylmethionine-8-amino-7-oxononanoate aminotransferase